MDIDSTKPTTSCRKPGGFLRDFINSGFSRTTEKGAGYGMGDDLINRIF